MMCIQSVYWEAYRLRTGVFDVLIGVRKSVYWEAY